MMPARETRRERQLFVQRLEDRSTAERTRIMKEHAAFLAGERETDADYGEDPAPPAAPAVAPRQGPDRQRRIVPASTAAAGFEPATRSCCENISGLWEEKTGSEEGRNRRLRRLRPELDDEAENSDEQDEDAAAIPSKGKGKAPARTLPPKKKKEKVTKASTPSKKPRKPSAA
ncbi:hypothetical protein PC129_g21307 [Phytophthora cactorum]|uniref:Uncharacterized protein n=1 Tax=Phytophthora cactorum TaxID=29920 RepID=A0A329SC98_9STRA|nr:hypothetical protein Pcac1_g11191 [Phytophthora cactorum]KAG2823004.1 hypothetical protein PC112_g10685 [Phytophthora cactorum]KAG2829676.1 hypothetical protein PC111_g7680 [Phytophthora cactorum]KAG2857278.1 hypothetical protein PC113_g10838 [Phytophthora cactorum]KAG2904907.1 hypothetical protein PC114_g11714 [Phytophthora cactorum]